MLDRLKEYIDIKGMTVASVERMLGMSNGALSKPIKNHTSIGSDKLENILIFCPDLSLEWLFFGKGEMLQTETPNHQPVSALAALEVERNLLQTLLIEKETTIIQQAKEIGKLTEQIRQLEQRLGKNAGGVNIGDTANAG